MISSVLLDTSFLISLIGKQRPHHRFAQQYYEALIVHNIQMYFSTIAAAEFAIGQPLDELPLKNFLILPFSLTHAAGAARLWNLLGPRDLDDARAVVRDDVKLVAQAACESIQLVLTEDASTLYKYSERLRLAGHSTVRAIKLRDGFNATALG